MRRTRFQHGCLQLAERKHSQRAWEYRWYEPLADGRRRRRSLVVGSLEQYPNEAAAKRAVASLLVNINSESPRFGLKPVSVRTLIEHYQEKELHEASGKTFATCETYKGYFRKWILLRWGDYRLKDVKSVAVEQGQYRLAYFPAHLCDAPQSEWRGCQNGAGAPATCQQPCDDEPLCSGRDRPEAQGAESHRGHAARQPR